MNNRNYNIYFHTHTISGIIISAILYVIFFAGSFSFFKSEISNWQANTPMTTSSKYDYDFSQLTDSLNKEYNLYGRRVSYYIMSDMPRIGVSISESKDTTNKKPGGFFYINTQTSQKSDYEKSYDLGEFLYRLHFLAQLNSIGNFGFPLGNYIAGLVAFLFLFALITGLLLHWNKIVSNFYVFRPWEKLKTVWTDLHTALGVLSFPFLFLFAVTGSFFIVGYPLFSQPIAALNYGGNQDSLFHDLGYGEHDVSFLNKPSSVGNNINYFVAKAKERWPHTNLTSVEMINYGDESMLIEVSSVLPKTKKLVGNGQIVYKASSGQIIEVEEPDRPAGYSRSILNLFYSLHFGDYGGIALKVLYFLLGICGCIVIISGVLIWLTARNKKNIPEKKRKFNEWLIQIYLAICLSLFPVTAASFIAVKVHPHPDQHFIYSFFFWSWLAVSILLLIRRNNYKTNRDTMLVGSSIGFCIPIVNGIITHNWLWVSWSNKYYDILLIDLFWIFIAIGGFICWWLIIRKKAIAKQV